MPKQNLIAVALTRDFAKSFTFFPIKWKTLQIWTINKQQTTKQFHIPVLNYKKTNKPGPFLVIYEQIHN